ncbi:dual specificity protein phosphatase family protein [Deinococcus altitudinis]|uniref:phosphatase domain-containing putative toxin n=1 Tax=Deinococcus altitudinis TaxID=468914 RepID=UPI0038924C54
MSTDPLRVAWMEDPALTPLWPGRLGLTIAPGKKGVSVEGNLHDRDLSADLTQLSAEGVTRLVNLMEAHEETRWKMYGYDDAAARAGLKVRRFPVVDVNVPTDPAAFAGMVEEVYAELNAGETVVAHCLGGLGRSGMLVACLLVRSGEFTAEGAIAFVRSKRSPQAVEGRQPQFVQQYFQNLDR